RDGERRRRPGGQGLPPPGRPRQGPRRDGAGRASGRPPGGERRGLRDPRRRPPRSGPDSPDPRRLLRSPPARLDRAAAPGALRRGRALPRARHAVHRRGHGLRRVRAGPPREGRGGRVRRPDDERRGHRLGGGPRRRRSGRSLPVRPDHLHRERPEAVTAGTVPSASPGPTAERPYATLAPYFARLFEPRGIRAWFQASRGLVVAAGVREGRHLDVGAGTCRYSRYWTQAGFRTVCVDVLHEMLRLARLG